MMDVQKFIDTMSETARDTRSKYHVTLGALIAELEKLDYDRPVEFAAGGSPRRPHSYRGYYSDLSFEPGSEISSSELLAICRDALRRTFEGYKGGDFVMGKNTPLWASEYGCCGPAIVAVVVTPLKVVLATKDLD